MKRKQKFGLLAGAGVSLGVAVHLAIQSAFYAGPLQGVAPVALKAPWAEPKVETALPHGALNPPTLIRIVDGDTLHVLVDGVDVTVRLLRINTPERGKPGFKEGTETLTRLVTGKVLRLEYEVAGTKAKDRYGRDLAYLYADGVCVNVLMVRSGWSEFYVKYGKGKYARLFEDAEREAREAHLGLWAK
jgi:endonuclease YncB( thermonuclease family)